MSHVSKLLLLSCLTCVFACSVPTIEELDEERPIEKCSADHDTCAPGSVCFQERCIRFEGLACKPGTRRACGSSQGECRPGTELCGAEGIFGACEGAVMPVPERCDGKDNDCNGMTDQWPGRFTLTQHHDLSSFATATGVRRTPDGKQDTLLAVKVEAGSIVASTLEPDGTWKQGWKFSAPANQFVMHPAVAADGDTVALAWQTKGSGASPFYVVNLLMLDGSGAAVGNQALDIPHGVETVEVSEIKVALNKTHVLVFMTTALKESLVVTVARNLDARTRRGPLSLGVDQSGRWSHVTANGTRDMFVVAYEGGYYAQTSGLFVPRFYTGVVSNEAELLGRSYIIEEGGSPHSPFIHPLQGDPWQYTVYYVENGISAPNVSRVSIMKCLELGCEPLTSPNIGFVHAIHRMDMVARPGAQVPELALWRWRDSGENTHSLTAVAITPVGTQGEITLTPPGPATVSESLILMPDSTRYMLYNQPPPPPPPATVSSLAIGSAETEAHLTPFCGP